MLKVALKSGSKLALDETFNHTNREITPKPVDHIKFHVIIILINGAIPNIIHDLMGVTSNYCTANVCVQGVGLCARRNYKS